MELPPSRGRHFNPHRQTRDRIRQALADPGHPLQRPRAARRDERFHLAGDTLTVASTWTDKKALSAPYHYTLTYRRLPSSYTPVEHYCDPRNNGVGHAAP